MKKPAIDLDALIQKWPSAYVARKDVGKLTGGLIAPGTVANHDCAGTGPEGSVRIGRQIGYPVVPFVHWMKKLVKSNSPAPPPGPRSRRRRERAN